MRFSVFKGMIFGSVISLAGAMAMADGLTDPAIEPPLQPVVPSTSFSGEDWTGPYIGLNIGSADVATSVPGVEGDGGTFGIHAGYDYDFGRFVLGGELEYDETDVDLGGAATVDNVARLKLRGGYDLGRTMIYATAGAARADTSLGSETGEYFGIGLNFQVNDRLTLGGEVLEHRFDDVGGSGIDADATTFNLRGSFRF